VTTVQDAVHAAGTFAVVAIILAMFEPLLPR
jgi:hypothetical protein